MSAITEYTTPDLLALREVLEGQRAQRYDVVAPAAHVHADGGRVYLEADRLVVEGGPNDGHVFDQPRYDLTKVAIDGFAEKLNVPRSYLHRLATEHVELFDQNVNGWLQHDSKMGNKYLVRILRDAATGEGVVRSFLTNGYRLIENLDVLTAAVEGMNLSGKLGNIVIRRCDLTERKMYVNIYSPDAAVAAPRLLDGYRGPWHVESLAKRRVITPDQVSEYAGQGMLPTDSAPLIFGGLVLSNSDVGCGAFSLSGQLMVLRCGNGMTSPAGKLRKTHVGDRHDVGEIDWATDTQEARLTEIKLMTRDSVKAFLSPAWVARQVAELEESAGVAVTQPEETIKAVTKKLNYSEDTTADVFAHFIAGGQLTAGGVMAAVTSAAQTVRNGDDAAQMEADAFRALDLAAAHATA
jgi:hypothetical protein